MEQQEYTQEEVRELELNYKKTKDALAKQDEDAIERIERLEDSLAKREYELDIKIKENEDLRAEFKNFTENPIKFVVKSLIRDDFDIKDALESEIDSQLYSVKNELFDELDDRLDDIFNSRAFQIAVDEHMRSKF